MFDAERLLGQLLSGALGGGDHRRRRRRGSGGGGLQLGLGAVGIAMAAWEHFSQQRQSPATAAGQLPAPLPTTPPPPPPGAAGGLAGVASSTMPPPPSAHVSADDAVLLIRAMIASAAVDGRIDETEQARILERLVEGGLDKEERAFLLREMAAPADAVALVGEVPPHLADAYYAATVLAIDLDSEAERAHVEQIAGALGLSTADRARIEASLPR